jgi:probable HAF family extracellular repeat protein
MRQALILLSLLVGVVALLAGASGAGAGSVQQRWVMRDLGMLGGAPTMAVGINDRGQVIGWAETGERPMQEESVPRAFVWEKGRLRELGTLGGAASIALAINNKGQIALAINNKGQIVGSAATRETDQLDDQVRRAVVWENGRLRDLGTLGGPYSEAVAINESGQVVGWSEI